MIGPLLGLVFILLDNCVLGTGSRVVSFVFSLWFVFRLSFLIISNVPVLPLYSLLVGLGNARLTHLCVSIGGFMTRKVRP